MNPPHQDVKSLASTLGDTALAQKLTRQGSDEPSQELRSSTGSLMKTVLAAAMKDTFVSPTSVVKLTKEPGVDDIKNFLGELGIASKAKTVEKPQQEKEDPQEEDAEEEEEEEGCDAIGKRVSFGQQAEREEPQEEKSKKRLPRKMASSGHKESTSSKKTKSPMRKTKSCDSRKSPLDVTNSSRRGKGAKLGAVIQKDAKHSNGPMEDADNSATTWSKVLEDVSIDTSDSKKSHSRLVSSEGLLGGEKENDDDDEDGFADWDAPKRVSKSKPDGSPEIHGSKRISGSSRAPHPNGIRKRISNSRSPRPAMDSSSKRISGSRRTHHTADQNNAITKRPSASRSPLRSRSSRNLSPTRPSALMTRSRSAQLGGSDNSGPPDLRPYNDTIDLDYDDDDDDDEQEKESGLSTNRGRRLRRAESSGVAKLEPRREGSLCARRRLGRVTSGLSPATTRSSRFSPTRTASGLSPHRLSRGTSAQGGLSPPRLSVGSPGLAPPRLARGISEPMPPPPRLSRGTSEPMPAGSEHRMSMSMNDRRQRRREERSRKLSPPMLETPSIKVVQGKSPRRLRKHGADVLQNQMAQALETPCLPEDPFLSEESYHHHHRPMEPETPPPTRKSDKPKKTSDSVKKSLQKNHPSKGPKEVVGKEPDGWSVMSPTFLTAHKIKPGGERRSSTTTSTTRSTFEMLGMVMGTTGIATKSSTAGGATNTTTKSAVPSMDIHAWLQRKEHTVLGPSMRPEDDETTNEFD